MKIVRYERIRVNEDENRTPLWLMGVTDLVTLLLAFFILLFATSIPESDAWHKASDSMKQRFSGQLQGAEVTGQSGHKDAEKTWQSDESDPGLQLDYLYSVIKKYIESDVSFQNVLVHAEADRVILSLGEDLTFDPGQVNVSSRGEKLLRKLSDYLDTLPNRLEVVGYADQLPLRSDARFNSNWHLSLERAYQVAQTLKQRGYKENIAIRGKGISEPDILSKPFLQIPKKKIEQKVGQNIEQKTGADFARRVDLRLYLLQP